MDIQKYINVANIFKGKTFDEQQESELFKETLILTLSRMTRADLNTDPAEVDAVINYVKQAANADVSAGTIRTAASSELFESTPLDKQLKKIAKHLNSDHRKAIVKGLIEIIASDGRVSYNEKDLFDSVVTALNVTPSELVGL